MVSHKNVLKILHGQKKIERVLVYGFRVSKGMFGTAPL